MFPYDPMSCTKICWDNCKFDMRNENIQYVFFVTENTNQGQTTYNLDPRQRDEE